MTDAPQVKGWCPGALRPMMSGDGMVVRIRPFNGRLRRAQADGIASLAAAHGNGLLDLSSRGNIQIRGVTEASYKPLIQGLRGMGLIDPSPEVESRRNLIITPFWIAGDDTESLAAELTEALSDVDAPILPGKFGFAIDTGRKPVLQNGSADIRLECDAGGGYILVADGMTVGKPVAQATAVSEAMALAQWFMDHRGDARRMRVLIEAGIVPPGHFVPRQNGDYLPAPGYTPTGAIVGLAFGQLRVETLSSLAKHGGIRMTPWRLILVESARELPRITGVITDAADPLLRVTACTGAPRCAQGLGETRTVAATLAPHLPTDGFLHVSGCAKGCAHPLAAPLTVTAQPEGYALIRDGKASDAPLRSGLSPDELKDIL